MSREVESAHQFERSQKFRLDKEYCIIRCNDGAVYEFEKAVDEPDSQDFRLVKAFQPNGDRTHTGARAVLPDAVEETVKTLVGGWTKG